MRLVTTVLLAALTLGSESSLAARDHDRARSAVRAGQVVSLGEILPAVRRQFPGRVLDAGLIRRKSDGHWIYRLKILRPNGAVTRVRVDGRTGAVLGTR